MKQEKQPLQPLSQDELNQHPDKDKIAAAIVDEDQEHDDR